MGGMDVSDIISWVAEFTNISSDQISITSEIPQIKINTMKLMFDLDNTNQVTFNLTADVDMEKPWNLNLGPKAIPPTNLKFSLDSSVLNKKRTNVACLIANINLGQPFQIKYQYGANNTSISGALQLPKGTPHLSLKEFSKALGLSAAIPTKSLLKNAPTFQLNSATLALDFSTLGFSISGDYRVNKKTYEAFFMISQSSGLGGSWGISAGFERGTELNLSDVINLSGVKALDFLKFSNMFIVYTQISNLEVTSTLLSALGKNSFTLQKGLNIGSIIQLAKPKSDEIAIPINQLNKADSIFLQNMMQFTFHDSPLCLAGAVNSGSKEFSLTAGLKGTVHIPAFNTPKVTPNAEIVIKEKDVFDLTFPAGSRLTLSFLDGFLH